MRVFIAAPLFSEAEREFNRKIDELLRSNGFETVLPQRDIGDAWTEGHRRVFEKDLAAIDGSDVVVAVLDGPDVDSGTAFEIGYSFARGKPVIGLKTDRRTFAPGEEVNNMILQAAARLVRDPASLPSAIREAAAGSRSPNR